MAAMYGVTAVHACFGDVELAQMTLRGGLGYGMMMSWCRDGKRYESFGWWFLWYCFSYSALLAARQG